MSNNNELVKARQNDILQNVKNNLQKTSKPE